MSPVVIPGSIHENNNCEFQVVPAHETFFQIPFPISAFPVARDWLPELANFPPKEIRYDTGSSTTYKLSTENSSIKQL